MVRRLMIAGVVGVVLMLIFTSVGNAAEPPRQENGRDYVVQADDWLSKLAEKYLGAAHLWNQIVEATNTRAATNTGFATIENPDLIYPGQILFIPSINTVLSAGGEQPGVKLVSLGVLCADQHPAVQAFCSEIPMARIHFDPHEEAEYFTCASRSGLGSVQIDPNEVTLLVPNDGDFDLRGITTAVKVTQDGTTLIPRWPGSRFDFSAEFAEKFEVPVGEQLAIPLAKAFELIKAGELIWTGQHGAPGKAGLFQTNPPLRCDPEETERALPGDELVPNPKQSSTRAVTIQAPAAEVWPWLAQLGQGRGGFYSYDWLENLAGCDIHNADRIMPEYQAVRIGDKVRLGPEGYPFYTVAAVEPGQFLLLRAGDPEQESPPVEDTWLFYLDEIASGTTRLIARNRRDYEPTGTNFIVWQVITEPLHFLMEQKMLRGLKARAEAGNGQFAPVGSLR